MNAPLDEARPVRTGEELDAATLTAYLCGTLPALEPPLEILQFPSGFSNLTYLLRFKNRELVLRRPPVGSKVKAAHDMGREYRVLHALNPVYPPAPAPLLFCEDRNVLGAPFYVMERITGAILRGQKPPGFECEPALVNKCCRSFIQNFVHLHEVDYAAIGLAGLRREGSFVSRNVYGWIDRYYGSKTDDIPAVERTAAYLKDNCPEDVGAVFIHNDYKFDNIVFDPHDLTRIIGVLDWEMCTIGDPLMDLGVVLSYWTEKEDPSLGMIPCFLTHEPGCMTRRQVADAYADSTGRDIGNLPFYYVFGLLKLAVIAQQIYYRFKQGLTKDARFGQLIFAVAALGMMAEKVIDTGEV